MLRSEKFHFRNISEQSSQMLHDFGWFICNIWGTLLYKEHFQSKSVNLFIHKHVKLSASWVSSLKNGWRRTERTDCSWFLLCLNWSIKCLFWQGWIRIMRSGRFGSCSNDKAPTNESRSANIVLQHWSQESNLSLKLSSGITVSLKSVTFQMQQNKQLGPCRSHNRPLL